MLRILFWGVLVNLVGAALIAVPIVSLGWEDYLDNRPWLAFGAGVALGLLVDWVMWRVELRPRMYMVTGVAAVSALTDFDNQGLSEKLGL